jgi:hypothetical protein
MDVWIESDQWKDWWMNGWMHRMMDGWMYGWMDEKMDKRHVLIGTSVYPSISGSRPGGDTGVIRG